MVIPAIVKDSEFRSEANSTVLKRNHSVVGVFNVISLISCSPVNVPTLLKCTANIFFSSIDYFPPSWVFVGVVFVILTGCMSLNQGHPLYLTKPAVM